ncbi:MAG: anhydro-N-acetylmuramic acid kinase [Candidatus Brocadiia bacterium]
MKELAALARKKTLRVAGLMSGTSADGVSAAIVQIAPRRIRTLAFRTFPYPPEIRKRVFALFQPETARLDEICRLNFLLGELFAGALIALARSSRIPLRSIDLVGSHGQTICHLPQAGRSRRRNAGSTLQIGEPCVIAERTGITTVADFRPRDIAAGGQGAPLVPYADYLLFRHPRRSRAIQNIGGIANVTWMPARPKIGDLIAFDTGPGNMMMDRVAQRITRGKRNYDDGGRLARRGCIDRALLAELLAHPFLRRWPPKSTGREEFGVAFADEVFRRARKAGVAPLDILATLNAFTSTSIRDAYRRFLPKWPDEVILCGGGARNRLLVQRLKADLKPSRVVAMDELGVSADAKEAVSFALLARETIRGAPNNVPSATGARKSVVLGKIVPGNR